MGQIEITDSKTDNLSAISSSARVAAAEGASLIVFPEFAMWFRFGSDELRSNAETIPGAFTQAIDDLTAELSIAIAVGMQEAVDDASRAFNTIYVTSSRGREIGRYRKVHLYYAYGFRESDRIIPSQDIQPLVFDLDGIRIGVSTYVVAVNTSAPMSFGCSLVVDPMGLVVTQLP